MDTVNAHQDEEFELIERARAGETAAFERLAERYAAPARCGAGWMAMGKDNPSNSI